MSYDWESRMHMDSQIEGIMLSLTHFRKKAQSTDTAIIYNHLLKQTKDGTSWPLRKKLPELTKEWWEKASYQLAWLRDDDTYHQQYGGVATIMDKTLTSCKYKSGNDKMGQWTWSTF